MGQMRKVNKEGERDTEGERKRERVEKMLRKGKRVLV